MRIKEIELDNFKSFARPTKIAFREGFTAIAGPNGSGKSNIIDAILFCLGLSNSRALRAEKLTDLINLNADKREARVTITFGHDGELDEQGQPKPDVTCARRIRENEAGYTSTYYLNGKACTLSDLHDMLALHNVGPHGYNVVMQGDVTRIISMTPTDRRKIIDELAGVAEFDARVSQATKELDAVNEQEDRYGLILGEIAERLVQLQTERDQALKYKALREERERLEALSKLSACWELKQKVMGLQDVIAAACNQETQLQAKVTEAEAEAQDRQDAYDALSAQIRLKGEDELLELQARLEEAKGALEKEAAVREVYLQTRGDLDRQRQRDTEALERQKARAEELGFQRQDLVTRKERHGADLAAARTKWEAAQAELKALYEAHSGIAEQGVEMRRKLNESKDKYNELWREKLRLEDASHRAVERREALEGEHQAAEGVLKGLTNEATALQAELDAHQKDVDHLAGARERFAEQGRQLSAEVEQLSRAAEGAREEHMRAEARLRAADGAGGQRAVETVLQSGLRGVHGTLAQLGAVDDEYAHALEIAAGARLRNLVVADDSVAAEGIALLKERRAGRATFLPLTKLAPPRRLVPVGAPGFIGYAVNLVRFDPKFAAAFHFALGDTLVVRDLPAARPYLGQYRMVTLEGDLLEKSGAMTGGASAKDSGVRFTASVAQEVEEARTKLEAALIRLARRKEDLARCQAEAERAREDARSAEDAVRRLQLELADRARRAGQAQADLEKVAAAIAGLAEEAQPTAERVAELADQLILLEGETNDLELALSDLEDQLQSEKLDELKGVVDSHDYTVQHLEASLRNCDYDLKDVDLEVGRVAEAIAAAEADLSSRAASEAELAAKVAASEEASTAHRTVLVELEGQREELRERLGELQREREKLADALRRAQKAVADRRLELDRLMEGVTATKHQLQEQMPKLRDLEDGLWMQGIEPPTSPPGDSTEEIGRQVGRLEGRMRALEPVNMLAIESYDREADRQQDLATRVGALKEEREQLLARIADIGARKTACFMQAYEVVDRNFREIFADLSAGTGQLVLECPEDPFAGGLIIKAQPRDKRMQRLEAMSGGEKSLTALAFVFAFQRHQPAPFYAFDEVDAALDGANAERLAAMVTKQTKTAQFIVVSHRKPMLEHAHHTLGVSTRKDGVTRVMGVTWDPGPREDARKADGGANPEGAAAPDVVGAADPGVAE